MRKRLTIVIVLILCLLLAFYPLILQSAAGFLVVQHELDKADVILVLAGDSNGERVAQAVKLYKQGWAPKIILSGGPLAWNLTYAQNMKDQARSMGVKNSDILIQDKARSTYEDLKYSLEIIKKIGAGKVILVSSPHHMRRVYLTARKMYGKEGIKILAYPAQKAEWNPKHWWLRHEDTQPVIYEYAALAQYLLKGWII